MCVHACILALHINLPIQRFSVVKVRELSLYGNSEVIVAVPLQRLSPHWIPSSDTILFVGVFVFCIEIVRGKRSISWSLVAIVDMIGMNE